MKLKNLNFSYILKHIRLDVSDKFSIILPTDVKNIIEIFSSVKSTSVVIKIS